VTKLLDLGAVMASPSVDGSTVYIAATDGSVTALE
jgi:hypothetical protein